MKRHIAVFIPSLRSGGVQRAMLNLAEGLLHRGVDVDFVLIRAEGPFMIQVPSGARIIDLGSKRALSSLPSLVKYLKVNRPDTLLSAQTHINILALWARFHAKSPTKIVISERSTLTAIARNATKLKERFRPLFARIFYSLADGIVAVSRGVAEDLAKVTNLPITSIQVIYNPVITPNLYIKAKEALDHPWFAQDDIPVLISVGRLTPAKNFPLLLSAFSSLLSSIDARLVILGNGEELPRLNRLARSLNLNQKVDFHGFVDNPYKYMTKAKVFVLSSAWEGFPNVLVEAMACGTPVVATDCPSGPYEILEGGKYGRLVPVGDIEALARAIAETLESPITPETLQRRARDFSVDKITDQYLRLLFE